MAMTQVCADFAAAHGVIVRTLAAVASCVRPLRPFFALFLLHAARSE
jgi:hypothetical protein